MLNALFECPDVLFYALLKKLDHLIYLPRECLEPCSILLKVPGCLKWLELNNLGKVDVRAMKMIERYVMRSELMEPDVE
jgi:hypothetical protein